VPVEERTVEERTVEEFRDWRSEEVRCLVSR
jgi:hypothetical protein